MGRGHRSHRARGGAPEFFRPQSRRHRQRQAHRHCRGWLGQLRSEENKAATRSSCAAVPGGATVSAFRVALAIGLAAMGTVARGGADLETARGLLEKKHFTEARAILEKIV